MSSSSPSLTLTTGWKYDTFINFRGADTRNNFIDYLTRELHKKGIVNFLDYTLDKGEDIASELFKAIDESMIAILVFSQNYADSPWCLEELVHIMECNKTHGKIALPIFYGVDPSEVEEQTGYFGEGFNRAKEEVNGDMKLVKKWKAALKEAANLSGWPSSDYRPDAKLIEEVVSAVLKKLNHSPLSDTEGLVGIESYIEQIDRFLSIGFRDVRVVGIWGMGGIGKTAVADAIFNRISNLFDSCYFLPTVRKQSEKMGNLALQEELFSVLLGTNLNTHTNLSFIRTRLRRKKVLVVLDDVSSKNQLELLAGIHWYGAGSRIIVTTRERNLLVSHGVDFICEIKDLNEKHSLELFSRHAFRQKRLTEQFTEPTMRATDYCKGLPIALKLLGSYLCGRSEREWKAALDRLEKQFDKNLQQILRISFDALDDLNKSLFLDIAIYFRGQDRNYAEKILTNFGFYPETGITDLTDCSLINVFDNTLGMHDLIQDLGREIVRQESIKHPGKRSRLWDQEDVIQVLMQLSGTKRVECMMIDLSKTNERNFSAEAFMKMKNLRMIDVHGAYGDRKVHLTGDFKFLHHKLKCLSWEGYPLKDLPANFNPKNIVMIEMPRSSIKQLWKGVLCLNKLQHIDLSHSVCLTETPNFTGVPNLEVLILEGCKNLSTIHPSLGLLKKLILLNLKNCHRLKSLPRSIEMESLNTLLLSGCSKLGQFPEIVGNMKHLSTVILDGTAITELPLSIKNLTGVLFLSLRNCKMLRSLPSNINFLKSLKNLDLFGCSKFDKLPESLGYLRELEKLDVAETSVCQPPSSIRLLKNLKVLSFGGCKPIWHWSYMFFSMFGKGNDSSSLKLPSLKGLHSLTELDLSDCNLSEEIIPGDFHCLPSLEVLNLSKNNFVNTPESISRYPQLRYLYLDDCKSLKAIGKLPITIHEISANNCTSLEALSSPEATASKWKWPIFYFTNCYKLVMNQGYESTALKFLRSHLQSLPISQLQQVSYQGCRFDVIVPGTEIPYWFRDRKKGSSVILQLSPNWYNEKLKGVAVCSVFTTNEASDIAIYCKLEAIVSSLSRTCAFKFLIYGIPSVRSDHIWMGFHSRFGFGTSSFLNKCDFLKVSFEASSPGMEVKKCGIHMVYDENDSSVTVSTDNNAEYEPMIMIDEGCKLKRYHETKAFEGGHSSLAEEPFLKRLKKF